MLGTPTGVAWSLEQGIGRATKINEENQVREDRREPLRLPLATGL